MINENTPNKGHWYGPYEDYEARCQRRLQRDLGVDGTAAETILHLRKQVVELQSHIRQLEIELTLNMHIKIRPLLIIAKFILKPPGSNQIFKNEDNQLASLK